MREIKREASGYLSSGKIHFEVEVESGCLSSKNNQDKVTWQCQVCEDINEADVNSQLPYKCTICGSSQKGDLKIVSIDDKSEIAAPWKCEVCDEVNDGMKIKCPACGFGKPIIEKDNKEEDELQKWTCHTCTFVNTFPKSTRLEKCQICEAETQEISSSKFKVSKPKYKLSFKSGGSTLFYDKLKESIKIQRERESNAKDDLDFFVDTIGISGLLRRQEEANLQTKASLSTAFSDLDTLMRSASEMVSLASRISEKLKNDNLSEPERYAFANLIESLGIQQQQQNEEQEQEDDFGFFDYSDNEEFYKSIAFKLSKLVEAMIKKTGTRVYSLADIFCIYNRTRQTSGNLIAPADLLKAARQLSKLALPIRLHKFTLNGMLCLIPSQDLNPTNLYALLSETIQKKNFVTAIDLAEKMNISILLAGQQLEMAEAAGKIVKDSKRKDITAYYPNLFLSQGL